MRILGFRSNGWPGCVSVRPSLESLTIVFPEGERPLPLYDAFISYSHAKDKPIAAALQSVIQKLGKP